MGGSVITTTARYVIAMALLAGVTMPAGADEVADFYKGKTVTLVVGHEPGTGFDVYARVLQRHLRPHIPGNPSVIVQNMPGVGGLLMSTITSTWREDYEAGNFFPVIQLSGRTRIGKIANVDDFVKSDDDRQVHGLIFGAQALGKLYAAPPGVPAVRRDALRAALMAAMKDPAFVAEAAKTQMDVSPMTGAEVEAFIAGLSVASPAVIERVKQAYMP
jgi:tripartite-type tricarboxylate transporter receptor subunit TctC